VVIAARTREAPILLRIHGDQEGARSGGGRKGDVKFSVILRREEKGGKECIRAGREEGRSPRSIEVQ